MAAAVASITSATADSTTAIAGQASPPSIVHKAAPSSSVVIRVKSLLSAGWSVTCSGDDDQDTIALTIEDGTSTPVHSPSSSSSKQIVTTIDVVQEDNDNNADDDEVASTTSYFSRWARTANECVQRLTFHSIFASFSLPKLSSSSSSNNESPSSWQMPNERQQSIKKVSVSISSQRMIQYWQQQQQQQQRSYAAAAAVGNTRNHRRNTIITLLHLGQTYMNCNEYVQAKETFRLAVENSNNDVDDPLLSAKVMDRLGEAMLRCNDTDIQDIQQILESALTIRERVLGPHHIDTVDTRNRLAAVYVRSGKQAAAAALKMYHCVLNDRRDIFGPDHPSVAVVAQQLSVLYGRQRQQMSKQAETYYEIAHEIYTRRLRLPKHHECLRRLEKERERWNVTTA